MADALWKKAERRICQMLGGTRRGPTGRDTSDCYHDWLAIEVKANRKMPEYLEAWMQQAENNAEAGKLPLVVWHNVQDQYANALVVMRLHDFLDYFGNGDAAEELPFTDLYFVGGEVTDDAPEM